MSRPSPTAAPSADRLREIQQASTLGALLGARGPDVYFSTLQAAEYVGSPSRESLIKWCRRNGIAVRKPSPKARNLVVRKSDLDWALRIRDGAK